MCIPLFMKNHEEPEAVDLLMEVESLDSLTKYTNESQLKKIFAYFVLVMATIILLKEM